MARFDDMGRDEFLRAYGFGPARKFWLSADGKRYDSKAIVGVAWGIQRADGRTWLRADDFSGGEATVRRKLESLGFSVLDATKTYSSGLQTWIFQGTPKAFNVSGFLATSPRDFLWLANQNARRMAVGDKVFIWQSIGNGDRKHSGVLAEAEIVEPARLQVDDHASRPFWQNADAAREATELKDRVRIRLLSVAEVGGILQRDAIASDPVLGTLSIFSLRTRTNFLLTSEQATSLEAAWSSLPKRKVDAKDDPPDAESVSATEEDIDAINADPSIDATTRAALIDARRGQGSFRRKLMDRWRGACAATGITAPAVLRASHTKPWRRATNSERLDSSNGLLLAAHLDALYDSGLISFADDGKLMISARVSAEDRDRLNLPGKLRFELTAQEKSFLEFHRLHCFEP